LETNVIFALLLIILTTGLIIIYLSDKYKILNIITLIFLGFGISKLNELFYGITSNSLIYFLIFFSIIFIFFMLGNELFLVRLKRYAGVLVIITLIKIFLTLTGLYYTLLYILKLNIYEAFFLALGLTTGGYYSIIKLLYLLKINEEANTITIGIFLVESTIILVSITLIENYIKFGTLNLPFIYFLLSLTIYIGLILLGLSFIIRYYLIRKIIKLSKYYIFITFLSLSFVIAYIGILFNILPLLGIFLTSLVFATTKIRYIIYNRIKIFADIFYILFIILILIQIKVENIYNLETIKSFLFLSLFFFPLKFFTTYFPLKAFKYDNKTVIKCSIYNLQCGEISLFLLIQGISLNLIRHELLILLILFILLSNIVVNLLLNIMLPSHSKLRKIFLLIKKNMFKKLKL